MDHIKKRDESSGDDKNGDNAKAFMEFLKALMENAGPNVKALKDHEHDPGWHDQVN